MHIPYISYSGQRSSKDLRSGTGTPYSVQWKGPMIDPPSHLRN